MKTGLVKRCCLLPFSAAIQAWKDYKHGRSSRIILRQQSAAAEEPPQEPQTQDEESQEGGQAADNLARKQDETETSPEEKKPQISERIPPRESKLAAESKKATPDDGDVPVWRYNHRNTEFPWRIERTVQPHDADWRGTWILEAKDMWSIDWQQGLTPEGVRPPQAHWPFVVVDRRRREGGLNGSRGGESTGSDELLDLLRRPKPTIKEQTGCESHT